MHAILRLCCCCCGVPKRSRRVAAEPSNDLEFKRQQLLRYSLPQLLERASGFSKQRPNTSTAGEAAVLVDALLKRWTQSAGLAPKPGSYTTPCSSATDLHKALTNNAPPDHPWQQDAASKPASKTRSKPNTTVTVAALQQALAQLSGLLLGAHRAVAAAGTSRVKARAAAEVLCQCSSPAADQLVALLRAIQMPQINVETQPRLQHHQEGVKLLLSALGLPSVSHLAACCSPNTRGLLAYWLQGSSSSGDGERKVNLVVARDAALWDALSTLQKQPAGTLLPAADKLEAVALAAPVAAAGQPAAAAVSQPRGRAADEEEEDEEEDMMITIAQAVKLFPRFKLPRAGEGEAGGVEAGEGHGPRKEWFLLLGTAASAAARGKPAVLTWHKPAEAYWFNSQLAPSPDLLQAYWLLGWAAGQALHNRAVLGQPLAPLLWVKLLEGSGFEASMELLQQHDPAAAQQVASLQQLPARSYKELLQMDDLPLDTPREEYVQMSVERLLIYDVDWQFGAFQAGFWVAVDPEALQQCCLDDAVSLAEAITGCGSSESGSSGSSSSSRVDVQKLFRVVMEDGEGSGEEEKDDVLILDSEEEDGQDTEQSQQSNQQQQQQHSPAAEATQQRPLPTGLRPVVECLWLVLGVWTPAQQRSFVRFVTGTDRLPAPGTEVLTISSPFVAYNTAQQAQLLCTLPQAHTCSNTLELPNYWEALGAVGPPAAAAAARAAGLAAAQAVEEMAAAGGGKKGAVRQQQPPDWLAAVRSSRSSNPASYWGGAAEKELQLVQQCCSILHARLLVATSQCSTYALDDHS